MTPAEVARFFGRDDHKLRQLIIRPTARPMVLQRAFYDKNELFKGKFQNIYDAPPLRPPNQ
jgi:type IV secretion system protein VirD4